jgi:ABC-type multidrug transport system fused ATPase/permease subunit
LYWGNLTSQATLQKAVHEIRCKLARRTVGIPAVMTERFPPADLLQRIDQDIEIISVSTVEVAPTLLRLVASTVFVLFMLFRLNVSLAAGVIPVVAIALIVRFVMRNRLKGAADNSRSSEARRSSALAEILWNLREIQVINGARRLLSRLRLASFRSSTSAVKQQKLELANGLCTMTALSFGTLACLGWGSHMVQVNALTVGGYVAFYSYLRSLFEQCNGLLDRSIQVQRMGASVRRLHELDALEFPAHHVKDETIGPISSLHLQNATFGYDNTQQILKSLSFSLSVGERMLIAGPSGEGKTTLLHLLCRQFDLSSGKAFLGRHEVTHVVFDHVARFMSFVPQHVTLFSGSLRFNATIGVGRHISEEELASAAERCQFLQVVNRHRDRWEYEIPPGGAGLSGGECQRLGILRAILRRTTFVLLDEAMSGLDEATEKRVLNGLAEYSTRGLLLVSHRAAARRWATTISSLTAGELVTFPPEEKVS